MNKAIWAALWTALSAATLLLAGCEWGGASSRPVQGASAVTVAAAGSATHGAARAARPGPDASTLRRLETFGFSAFVVPVLDDDAVTHFADPHLAPLCGEDTEVRVDGRPLVAGATLPAGAFELAWDMHMFCPFGPDGVALDGRTRVLVFRDDEHGMEALVLPQGLTVSDERGAVTLTAQAPHWVSTQWRTPRATQGREQ